MIHAFDSLDPSHNVDNDYWPHLTENAPSIKLAEANVQQALADLDRLNQLELLRRLCRDRRRGHEPQRQSRQQRDRGSH